MHNQHGTGTTRAGDLPLVEASSEEPSNRDVSRNDIYIYH